MARDLPKWLHLKHGAFYLVRNGKWERLSRDRDEALRLYALQIEQTESEMCRLIDDAIRLRPDLRDSTRKQYKTAAVYLKEAFGHMHPRDVTERHVHAFKRDLAAIPNMANRCLAVLRIVYQYALTVDMADRNPARVERYREHPRERLITPDEYAAIYAQAGARLRVIMDLCYLTAQRIGDVLSIRRSQLRDGGIEFVQQKTGNRLMVRAPGLEAVIERAKALHPTASLTLLRGRWGGAPDYRSVRDQWDVACRKAGVADAHLHDLRAMALTDADREGLNATRLAGHSTEAVTRRYLRSKAVPDVVGPSTLPVKRNRQ